MQSFHLSLQYSAWWLLAIVTASAALAWLLYSGKTIWNKRMRWTLSALRFIAIFLVLFLLINPRITLVKSFKERPVFPIAVDNSQSVALGMKDLKLLKETILSMQKKLIKMGFDSPIYLHAKKVESGDSITFNHSSSDIVNLLAQAEKTTSGKKSENVLFFSDGIFNSGISPAYQPYHARIFTLGLGDTVPRKDLALKSLQNNSVAFLGNKFPIKADVQVIGYPQRDIEVVLRGNKGIVERQKLRVQGEFWLGHVDFVLPANEKGFQRYTIEILPLTGESNLFNNKMTTYVDIVDDHEKILLVASSPHPNIKAICAALAKMANIQVELLIPGIKEAKNDVYDMVLLHNCLLSSLPEAARYLKENTPIFYIAGSRSDFGRFNMENGLVQVVASDQTDQILGMPNGLFSRFKLNESAEGVLVKLPPIEVAFGEMKVKSGIEVLLYQKINGVSSGKPLLLFGNGSRKTGVLLTDGLWQWRMYEGMETGNAEVVDELIIKTVQYLSSKEDKRKFRVYPHQREYNEGETPRLESELYDDLYEKVYGKKTTIRLSSANTKPAVFEFTPLEGNSSVSIPSLAAGVYKVEAHTNHSGKILTSFAEFIVKERQLEVLDLRANHPLLREISTKNKGEFYPWHRRDQLLKSLENLEAKSTWKSKEETRGLIDEKWYFFLILAFLTTEWVMRRYTGGY